MRTLPLITCISAAVGIALLLATGGCAHGSAELQRTCVEPKEEPMLPLCTNDLASCDARIRFVRRSIASTVVVTTYLRVPEEGVMTHTGSGTVIAISGRKYILTGAHVVKDALLITIKPRILSADGKTLSRGDAIPVKTVAIVERMDAALLEPRFADELPAAMAVFDGRPEEDEMLWQFGQKSHWREGSLVSDSASCGQWDDVLQTDMFCSSGDSGGALVTSTGKLAGILLGGEEDTIGKSGPSYFSPASETIRALVAAMKKKK